MWIFRRLLLYKGGTYDALINQITGIHIGNNAKLKADQNNILSAPTPYKEHTHNCLSPCLRIQRCLNFLELCKIKQ